MASGSDFISRVGKGKPNGVVEAIADTDMAKRVLNSPLAKSTGATLRGIAKRVLNSPLAKSTGATLRGIASGAAVPAALAADSVNTGVNAVNQALGGGANLLPANNTRNVINWGMNGSSDKPAAIAGPVPALASPQQPTAAQQTALQSTPATSSLQPAPAIAGGAAKLPPGVLQFQALGKPTSQAGVSIANGNNSDWSKNSPLATSATAVDNRGRTYDEQVAHAQEVNANTMRQLGQLSPREAAELAIARDPSRSRVTRSNAAAGAHLAESRIAGVGQQLKDKQAMRIANNTADAHKYAADQTLAGHKYTADANVKAHELTAIGNMEKAKIAGQEKQAVKQHEAYLKDENEMKSLLRDKYGVDPNVGLPAYKQHLQNLQSWDKQITKQLDLLKSGKAGYTPEQGTMIENALKMYHQNPQDKNALVLLEEARKTVTGGGKAQEPAWWGSAVSMPRFDYSKLPQLPTSKAVIAGA